MQPAIYRFEFDESVVMADVETTLHLAILGAEGLFGESSVRMDGAYSIDEQRRACVVDARNEVGRCICQIFTGYLGREIGGDAFSVRAVSGSCDTTTNSPVAVAT
jgi:hypothetical protein